MRRKVIKQKDSYTITLPIKWVREHGLDKKQEVDIEKEREGLLVKTKATPKKKGRITIDSSNKKFITYILNNAYRNGYDFLNITLPNKKTAELIESQLNNLLGWQIVERNKKLIIDSLTEPKSDNFDKLLRRVFLIIKNDLEELKNHLTKKSSHLKNIEKNAEEIIKIDNFCRRCISKRIVEKEKTYFYWHFISTITWVHRSLYYLTKDLPQKINLDSSTEELLENVLNSFNNLYEGFFGKDLNKISNVFNLTKDILENKKKFLNKNSLISYYLIEASRLINLSCSPCIGILV